MTWAGVGEGEHEFATWVSYEAVLLNLFLGWAFPRRSALQTVQGGNMGSRELIIINPCPTNLKQWNPLASYCGAVFLCGFPKGFDILSQEFPLPNNIHM